MTGSILNYITLFVLGAFLLVVNGVPKRGVNRLCKHEDGCVARRLILKAKDKKEIRKDDAAGALADKASAALMESMGMGTGESVAAQAEKEEGESGSLVKKTLTGRLVKRIRERKKNRKERKEGKHEQGGDDDSSEETDSQDSDDESPEEITEQDDNGGNPDEKEEQDSSENNQD